MKKANYIAGTLLLLFSTVILAACISSTRGNREVAEVVFFPAVLSVLIMVGSIAMMLMTRLGSVQEKIQFNGKVKEIVIAVVIMLMAYPLLQYFGFILSTIALCYGMFRLLGNPRKTSLVAAVLISVTVYVIFHYLLSVNLPKGLIMRKILQ